MATTQYYNLVLYPESTDVTVKEFRLAMAGESESNMTKIAAALRALDIGKVGLPATGAADGKVLKASVTGNVVTLVWGDVSVTVDTSVTSTGTNAVSGKAVYDYVANVLGDFDTVAGQMETLIGGGTT